MICDKCKIKNLDKQLVLLNQKITLWNKIYNYLQKVKIGKIVLNKLQSYINERDNCFKELREIMREKYPDKFIRSK